MFRAQFLLTMKTFDHLAIYVAVYNSKYACNALAGLKKYIEAICESVHAVFYHEGDIKIAYSNANFLSAESVQIRTNTNNNHTRLLTAVHAEPC